MIVYPNKWNDIGKPVTKQWIEFTIFKVVNDIDCSSISFSGGIDSSLLCYFALKRYAHVNLFTIGSSEEHPDVVYSRRAVEFFGDRVSHHVYIPDVTDIILNKRDEDYGGDGAVRLFYKFVKQHTDSIMACDGIDEYACGYYGHQANPTEQCYYEYISKLSENHLIPLNINSGDVKVYLPYLDNRITALFSCLPMDMMVDSETRKKILVEIAKDKLPSYIIERKKYGFCDALSMVKTQ